MGSGAKRERGKGRNGESGDKKGALNARSPTNWERLRGEKKKVKVRGIMRGKKTSERGLKIPQPIT